VARRPDAPNRAQRYAGGPDRHAAGPKHRARLALNERRLDHPADQRADANIERPGFPVYRTQAGAAFAWAILANLWQGFATAGCSWHILEQQNVTNRNKFILTWLLDSALSSMIQYNVLAMNFIMVKKRCPDTRLRNL
jgi:hypothetical protein